MRPLLCTNAIKGDPGAPAAVALARVDPTSMGVFGLTGEPTGVDLNAAGGYQNLQMGAAGDLAVHDTWVPQGTAYPVWGGWGGATLTLDGPNVLTGAKDMLVHGNTSTGGGHTVIARPQDFGGGTWLMGGTLTLTAAGATATDAAGAFLVLDGPVTAQKSGTLLAKSGQGTLGLFNAANAFTGLTVSGGLVAFDAAGALGDPAGTIGLSGGGGLRFAGAAPVTLGHAVSGGGGGGDGTIDAYAAGTLTLAGALASSGTSAATSNGRWGGGFAESKDVLALSGTQATFMGVPVDDTAVLVRTTVLGDANLDGVVNFADLLALAKNYGGTGATYAQGDFDGNGVVNFADVLILAKNYNKALPAPSSVATAAGVISIGSSEMPSLSAALAAGDAVGVAGDTSTVAASVPQPVTGTPTVATKPGSKPAPKVAVKAAKVPPRVGANPRAPAVAAKPAVALPPRSPAVFGTTKVGASKRTSDLFA